METPRVNPVGVVEYPEDYATSPRSISGWQRFFAVALLVFFFTATVVTSVVSIGGYCLTSDGGDTRVLQESVRRLGQR